MKLSMVIRILHMKNYIRIVKLKHAGTCSHKEYMKIGKGIVTLELMKLLNNNNFNINININININKKSTWSLCTRGSGRYHLR